jgi:hypothetical protein
MPPRPFRIKPIELQLVAAALCIAVITYWGCSRLFFYLDREPATLPLPEISEETEAAVTKFTTELQSVIREGAPLKTSLTETELNAWLRLSTDESLRLLAEHAWLSLRGGRVYATISLPLEIFGRPGLYFNAAATLSAALEAKRFVLRVEELKTQSASSQGVAWIIKLLYRESLPDLLQLRQLIPQPLLERCTGKVVHEAVALTCSEDSR